MKIHPFHTLALFALLAAGCDDGSDSKAQLNSEVQELHRSAHDFVETVKTLPKFIKETPGAIKAIYLALRQSDDISATEKESLNHFVTVFERKGEIKSQLRELNDKKINCI